MNDSTDSPDPMDRRIFRNGVLVKGATLADRDPTCSLCRNDLHYGPHDDLFATPADPLEGATTWLEMRVGITLAQFLEDQGYASPVPQLLGRCAIQALKDAL